MPPLNNLQRSCIGLAIGHALIVSPALQAATITVNSTDDGPVGQVPGCTLREAIASTNTQALQGGCAMTGTGPLDSIDFALPASSTIVLSEGELEITRTASITGPGATQLTIDAQGNSRIFNIDGSGSDTDTTGTSISGLTLTNGSASGQGGAVYVRNTTGFTLSDSTISNSYSYSETVTGGGGGGIAILYSVSASISGSTITSNNSSSTGNLAGAGGILIFGSNSASISGSTISNNTSSHDEEESTRNLGGGILIFGSNNSSISGSTISNNAVISTPEATSGGGIAIFLSDSISISNSTISNNSSSQYGGGISIYNGIYIMANLTNISIEGSTISTNVADGNGGGGGIFLRGVATILNSTISTNVADGNGGGLNMEGNGGVSRVSIYGSTFNGNATINGVAGGIYFNTEDNVLRMNNNIVANSVGADLRCSVLDGFSTISNWIEEDSSCFYIGPPFNLTGDPMLGPLQDNGGPTLTHAPLPGSGVINGVAFPFCDADNELPGITPLDQRGEPRATVDCFFGAVEGVQESEDNFFVIPLGNGRSVVAPL